MFRSVLIIARWWVIHRPDVLAAFGKLLQFPWCKFLIRHGGPCPEPKMIGGTQGFPGISFMDTPSWSYAITNCGISPRSRAARNDRAGNEKGNAREDVASATSCCEMLLGYGIDMYQTKIGGHVKWLRLKSLGLSFRSHRETLGFSTDSDGFCTFMVTVAITGDLWPKLPSKQWWPRSSVCCGYVSMQPA